MSNHLLASLKKFLKREEGVTAIEYALIAALIAVVIIGTVTAVGGGVNTVFGQVETALTPGGGAPAPAP